MLRDPVGVGLLALAVVLTVSLALPLSYLVWHALGHFPEIRRGENTARKAQAVDLTPIFTLAPFGVVSRTGPISASTSSLLLLGVIQATPSARSKALISDAGRPVKVFGVGQSLPDGSTLEAVGANHIVLLVSGRRELLGFLKSATTGAGQGAPPTAPIIPAASFTAPPGSPLMPDEIIDVYRQRVAANPRAVIDELGMSATPEGYRVGESLTPQLRRAGLRSGDLIVRVNGKAVGNLEQDRANFEDVALSGRARVEIIRGGLLLILSFPLR